MLSLGLNSISSSRSASGTFVVGHTISLTGGLLAGASISTNNDANFAYLQGANWRVNADLYVDGTVKSGIASGSNAFRIETAGARLKLSAAGTTDYFTSDGAATITAAGTLAVANGLTLTGSGINIQLAGGYLSFNGTTQGGLITSAIAAASAGATAASAAHRMYVDNALDATDWVLSIGNAANALSLFSVDYSGTVNIRAGTSTAPAMGNGLINANSTGVGNVGASGPDDLQTYTLAANTLTTTNRGIRIKAWGTTANNANAKTVRLTIGPTPTALVTKQLTASIAGFWEIECTILRTGSSTQDYFAKATNFGGTTVSSTDGATVALLASVGTLTQTETNALDIKVQSTASTSNNDIVSEGLIVEYI